MKASDVIVTHRAIGRALYKVDEESGLEGATTATAEQRLFEKACQAATQLRSVVATGALPASGDPAEATAMVAALSDALSAMEGVEQDPGVLVALPHETASLLQSYLAEKAAKEKSAAPRETGGLEARFDDLDIFGWVGSFFTWWRGLKKHAWLPPPTRPDAVSDPFRVGILGDWGTGLYGAPVCAASLKNDPRGYQLILHLGDVYYSGTEEEMADRFLALWPQRPGAVSRALNGNHEMYTGGHAYFKQTLREFGQSSSCFAMHNDHWLLVGLDTAYEDHDLDTEQGAWLAALVKGIGEKRKVVLFSHHQPYSLMDAQGPKLVRKVADLLAARRIFAWYWGHEHRCLLYDPHPAWGVHGRCIGHSGYPYFRAKLESARCEVAGAGFAWYRLGGKNLVPGALVLDGPNPYLPGQAEKYGCQGYATLEFNGPHLTETVHAPDGSQLLFRQLV
jgi:hypothetical protein